jgi:hypothetical protein
MTTIVIEFHAPDRDEHNEPDLAVRIRQNLKLTASHFPMEGDLSMRIVLLPDHDLPRLELLGRDFLGRPAWFDRRFFAGDRLGDTFILEVMARAMRTPSAKVPEGEVYRDLHTIQLGAL